WSRRFPQFSRTVPGFTASPTVPPPPGPARLLPDTAGPHSAGRASTGPLVGLLDELDEADLDEANLDVADLDADLDGGLDADLDGGRGRLEPARAADAGRPARGTGGRVVPPLRQWSVLTRRNIDVLARSRPTLAALAGAPVAVLLAFVVLLGLGAFDPARPGASFWAVFGGFFVGLAYGLPQIRPELGTLRAERFCGLSPGAYVLAKAAVLVPPLAVADAVILLGPGLAGRLGGGYGPTFVTVLLSSAAALSLGLLLSAVVPGHPRALTAVAACCLPPVLLAAAVLTLLHRPVWGNWLGLAACLATLLAATAAIIYRRLPSADR
ncbi:MAG TPA: ABC transporter permease, partial [Trebonia sp.]|nr:ABC transporter permease [Trebonia sp.]